MRVAPSTMGAFSKRANYDGIVSNAMGMLLEVSISGDASGGL